MGSPSFFAQHSAYVVLCLSSMCDPPLVFYTKNHFLHDVTAHDHEDLSHQVLLFSFSKVCLPAS